MGLDLEGYVDLPEHTGPGGFDHAAVHLGSRRLYVAHTANDAVDVIDLDEGRHSESISGLTSVAGVLVDEGSGRVVTSNRGEDTVGILHAQNPAALRKVPVGHRPGGLAFDSARNRLLAANVGDPADPASRTLSIIDARSSALVASIPVAGPTRWAVFDPVADRFFVIQAEPPSILVVDGGDPTHLSATIPILAAGPHGLDVDERGRLYCACDAGRLLVLVPPTYEAEADLALAGVPDVILLDRALRHLYVAIRDPAIIEVIDVDEGEVVEAVATEPGAHTIGLDPDRHRVYAFLPATHRAAVFASV